MIVETNIFDVEETHYNCTVQVLKNTITGEKSVGWMERESGKLLVNEFGYESCSVCRYGLMLFITDENNTLKKPNYCPNCGVRLEGQT